MEDTLQYLS